MLQFVMLFFALLADPIQYDRKPAPVAPVVVNVVPDVATASRPVRRLYVFGFKGCAPCSASRPNLDAWVKNAGLSVTVPTSGTECVYIDVEERPRLVGPWRTVEYPTVIVSDDLREVARHVGAYSVDDLRRLWDTGKASRGQHLASAFAAGAGTDIALPRVSVNPTTKAVTILETVDIPYGKFLTATLSQGCVLSMGPEGQYTFAKPYPRIRTSPIHWDGFLRGVKVNATARTAVLQIDGFPDQTIRY